MDESCAPAPVNKKEYITDIGRILVKEYGKKKYYKPEEVKEAHRSSKWAEDYDYACWGMCTFSSHSDFDTYHEQIGEVCDYAAMKSEMLSGLSSSMGEHVEWFNPTDIDIDASWLDFGDLFGDLIEGIGDFISGIFDGLH